MLRILDLSFYVNEEHDLLNVATQHAPAHLYAEYLSQYAQVEVIKHLKSDASVTYRQVMYRGFTGRNSFFHLPATAVRYIKEFEPDVIIVQGLVFPLQVLYLRMRIGKKPIILAQHHGEVPFPGKKGWLQEIAARQIDGFLFNCIENAEPWYKAGVFKGQTKCFELPEASTLFKTADKAAAKEKLGLHGKYNFLWVARLNEGKDPMTVIDAFETMYQQHPAAKLFMIFQTEELLPVLMQKLENNPLLTERVIIVGKKPHEELELWFNAADFFISASKSEAMGYAVLEAVSCSCIPIVSDIPAHRKLTANGTCGLLFKKGDSESLVSAFKMIPVLDREAFQKNLRFLFDAHFSPKAIADQLLIICRQVTKK